MENNTALNAREGKAFPLDPEKSYLILFERSMVPKEDLVALTRVIRDDLKVKNVICTVKGDLEDVKIVEATPNAA